jgi:hypothetical protein
MNKRRPVNSKVFTPKEVRDHADRKSSAWHEEELAATERRVNSGLERFVDWNEAKRHLRKSRK